MPALTRRHAAAVRLVSMAAASASLWARHMAERLQLWRERRRQRRALASVSDHMLKDMGLTRADAGRESEKQFWKG